MPPSCSSIRSASVAFAGLPKIRPSSTTAVSTPSTGPVLRDVGNGPRLLARMRAHDLNRVGDLRIGFFVLRRDDVKRDVQLLEDGFALR